MRRWCRCDTSNLVLNGVGAHVCLFVRRIKTDVDSLHLSITFPGAHSRVSKALDRFIFYGSCRRCALDLRCCIPTLSELTKLCEIVYLEPYKADTAAANAGWQVIRHIGNGGPHAMIVEDDDTIVVAVRGTERYDLWDWITNGRFLPCEPLPGEQTIPGRVHKGFNAYADDIWGSLPVRWNDRKSLWFVGHSLGGAAASLLATATGRISVNWDAKPNLLTVGAPRVGTTGFGNALHTSTFTSYRITNHRDPIPLLIPPYGHAPATEIHFDRWGMARVNPTFGDRFEDRAKGWGRAGWIALRERSLTAGLRHLWPAENHAIETYCQLMQRAAERFSFDQIVFDDEVA